MENFDSAAYQELMTGAIQKSRPCFTDDAFYRVAAAYPSYGIHLIVGSILDLPHRQWLTYKNPRSFEDFRANVGQLFDTQFLSHLEQKSKAFDVLCGEPHADALWGQQTYLRWAQLIADNCIRSHMEPLAREDVSDFEGVSSLIRPSNPASHANVIGSSPHLPAHGVQAAPITQINLRGHSIKEAWNGSSQANRICAFEQLQHGWSPSGTTDAGVFYGTSAHLRSRENEMHLDVALGTLPVILRPQPGSTPLYPIDRKYSGVFTSDLAIERFLWSIFMAEVIEDPAGPTPSGLISKTFQMRGRPYKGVLLVRFRPSQSAPNGRRLSSSDVPSGHEEAWQIAAHKCSNSVASLNFWEHVNHLHGQSTSHFPDVIHGQFLPALRGSLAAFTGKSHLFWQTAWMSREAIRTLNLSAQEIYAISFELVSRPKQAEQPVPLKKRQRVGAFVHKTRNYIKKALF